MALAVILGVIAVWLLALVAVLALCRAASAGIEPPERRRRPRRRVSTRRGAPHRVVISAAASRARHRLWH
jgi:peptidoglycan/LPS O-acetylase OafA/YrhL